MLYLFFYEDSIEYIDISFYDIIVISTCEPLIRFLEGKHLHIREHIILLKRMYFFCRRETTVILIL